MKEAGGDHKARASLSPQPGRKAPRLAAGRARARGRLLQGEADYQLSIIYLWYENLPQRGRAVLEREAPERVLHQRRVPLQRRVQERVGRNEQHLFGLATTAIMLLVARRSPAEERREMWFCVGFSTLVEIACTQLWGLYRYRLGNVPSFVPPGHGLIFLVAAQGARAPWARLHRRVLKRPR